MTDENTQEKTAETVETEDNKLASFDQVVNFVKTEIENLKKEITPPKKKPQKLDDFKLYHEQVEGKLKDASDRLESLESKFNQFLEKWSQRSNPRTLLENVYDFFFKP